MRRGGDGACRLVGLMNGPSISASANTRIATWANLQAAVRAGQHELEGTDLMPFYSREGKKTRSDNANGASPALWHQAYLTFHNIVAGERVNWLQLGQFPIFNPGYLLLSKILQKCAPRDGCIW